MTNWSELIKELGVYENAPFKTVKLDPGSYKLIQDETEYEPTDQELFAEAELWDWIDSDCST